MTKMCNLAFVRSNDWDRLEKAIILVNRTRQHRAGYKRIIRTAPRREWMAIITDCNDPDHYLLRNLSGRMETTSFELGLAGTRLYYRFHRQGETIHAYESDPALWIQQQLAELLNTGDVMHVDLAEPAGRFVMRQYHEYQRTRAWSDRLFDPDVPTSIFAYYRGDIADLGTVLISGVGEDIGNIIFSAETSPSDALDRLVTVLDLPYLIGDRVEVVLSKTATHTTRQYTAQEDKRIVTGYDILKPSSWPDGGNLPVGWAVLRSASWRSREKL